MAFDGRPISMMAMWQVKEVAAAACWRKTKLSDEWLETNGWKAR